MGRGEVNIDPIEGEFFSTEALGGLSEALIRESIQNSLDAALRGRQVLVRILIDLEGIHPTGSERYLSGLRTHLQAPRSGLGDPPAPDAPMPFLVIEDFGTRGLTGDPEQDEDQEEATGGPKNDFFYFWRNVGRTVEGATARGRWGLGKTVFQAASRINTFFGLTIRREDGRRMLLGQSVLKIHRLQGRKYAPYGYFGHFDHDFALPIEDPDLIDRFRRDFSLLRQDEPGLSVVVPFPDPEIDSRSLIQAVIHHYFHPILSKALVVSVHDDRQEHILDARSLSAFIAATEWEEKAALLKRLDLTAWSLDRSAASRPVQLKMPDPTRAPRWDESLFDPVGLLDLRERFEQGERIMLQVPLTVQRSGGVSQPSFFTVCLERDEELDRAEDRFIREGVTIAGVSSLRQRGIRALVSVTHPPLSRLLGDAENPAHTEWQERSPKFKGRYRLGPSCLRFVKNSPQEIVRILSRPAQGRDKHLLEHLFFVDLPPQDLPETKQRPADTAGPGESGPEGREVDITAQDRFLRLRRVKGGFRIMGNPEAGRMPKYMTVEVAYDVRRGNPFQQYQPLDFQFGRPPVRVLAEGASIHNLEDNRFAVLVERRDFQVDVSGFDTNRDLRIKTSTALDSAI